MNVLFLMLCFVSYLLGAVSFGPIWAKVFNLGDLRVIGSGNTGATNVLRTGNKTAALLTLFFDGFKGTCAVWLYKISPELTIYDGFIFGISAFLGHLYPVWLGFKGGKGVATYLGVLFGLNSLFGIFGCLLWLSAVLFFRISSLGALNMALLMPALLYIGTKNVYFVLGTALMSLLLCYKHQDNIKRLLTKTEPKIGQKK